MNEQPRETRIGDRLRLLALDTEDLAVVSAHLQDATIAVGDMRYLARERRFALLASRFDWCGAQDGPCERCQTGLHFEGVLRVRRAGFDQAPERMLTLVAITFCSSDPPGGTVVLTFAEGAALRLDVECLECAMQDLGTRWTVEGKPTTCSLDDAAAGPA